MTRRCTWLSVVPLLLCAPSGTSSADPGEPGRTLLAFRTMYGVDGSSAGEALAIRGIQSDSLPWTIESARGRLDTDGRLRLVVHGLVFTDDPEVPPALRGINDEGTFRVAVSCLGEDGDEGMKQNLFSEPFPATATGDAKLEATLALPQPCLAPLVFVVAGRKDKWLAVAGFEEEGDEE